MRNISLRLKVNVPKLYIGGVVIKSCNQIRSVLRPFKPSKIRGFLLIFVLKYV